MVEFTVTAIEQKTELPRFADLEPVAALFADMQRSACDESDGTCIELRIARSIARLALDA